MHISLDSALGQQRRLNSVGESITQIAPDPAAAYSLRSLTGADPKVVRVRRASDNHEQDFTASDVSSGALVDFVNAQVTAPLDIQALSATGRDGDFLIAKAAYSLRSLGTRQATLAATGDTVARANGKYVCQVRSVTGDIKSFTATEVSDGTLVDFVLGNTKSLLNSRAYFDGSNDNVTLTSDITMSGDFSIQYSFVVNDSTSALRILGKLTTYYVGAEGSGVIDKFKAQVGSTSVTMALTSNLKYGEENTVKFKRVSGKVGIYDESDTLISAEVTVSGDFVVNSFGKARGQFAKGVIYNIRIDTNNDGTIDHSYNGYGNSVSDWTDLVGSNNASAVNGSPALFTGQDQDGFVKTWYDQSVTTQAGDTATGNHVTQATAASQPKIVNAGSLVTQGGKANIDFSSSTFLSVSSFTIANASGHYSAMFVGKRGTDTSGRGFWGVQSQDQWGLTNTTGTNEMAVATVAATGYDTTSTNLHSQINDGTDTTIFRDGSQVATGTTDSNYTSPSTAALRVGSGRFDSRVIEGEIQELIIYNTDQTDNRTAIEANIGEAYSIDLPSGVDPGFDQVDGFVETWYDQSGNGNDAVQATAGSQPKIVSAGTFLNELDFDGTDDNFELTSVLGITSVGAIFTVAESGGGDDKLILDNRDSGVDGFRFFRVGNDIEYRWQSAVVDTGTTPATNTKFLGFANHDGSNASAAVNGATATTTSDTSSMSVAAKPHIGARSFSSASSFWDGTINELIIYASNQNANRTAIETNINGHYSIF